MEARWRVGDDDAGGGGAAAGAAKGGGPRRPATGVSAVASWLRSAAFNALFFPYSAAMSLLGLALLPAPRAWLIGWVRIWARGALWLLRAVAGIRVRVTGREHLPAAGVGAIIAAKHQSAFDTIIWLVLLPRPVYVLKRELLAVPVWGWLARRCGHVAVDRRAASAVPSATGTRRRLTRPLAASRAGGRAAIPAPGLTSAAAGSPAPSPAAGTAARRAG